MKLNQLIVVVILPLVLGSAFVSVNQIIYAPEYKALAQAIETYAKNSTNATPPSPEAFGITSTSELISSMLGLIGSSLILIGIACGLVNLITWILKTERKPQT